MIVPAMEGCRGRRPRRAHPYRAERAATLASRGLVGFLVALSGALGVAGGEMRILSLKYLIAAPVKKAGTISLIASIPTVAAGAFTYRKLGHIARRVMVLSLLTGPVPSSVSSSEHRSFRSWTSTL